jgi:hypothetical protein
MTIDQGYVLDLYLIGIILVLDCSLVLPADYGHIQLES